MCSDSRVALFETIFFETKDRVFGFLKKILHDDARVQDCMQQCYLKLWETLDTIDTDKEVLPLLFTYSRNICIDSLRKNNRYVWMDDLSSFSEKLVDERTPQAYINQKEVVTELEELLHDMPTRRKQVFKLIKLNGFTYREVAQQLNISVSTVEKHMHEAHKFLEI
jgi:RNA polymerase sigma-70 factor (ECF subfamily)